MSVKRNLVAISIGDINGIGPEIILKTFQDSRMFENCIPIVFAPESVLEKCAETMDSGQVELNYINSTSLAIPNVINVIPLESNELNKEPEKLSKLAGKVALESLRQSIVSVKKKETMALVTAPLSKSVVAEWEESFTGHTGFLGESDQSSPFMILSSENWRVGMVTGHIPISEVSSHITLAMVKEKIIAFLQSLKKDFGISDPKLAVLGLNPHAGDDGLLGREEIEQISPAIQQCAKEGMLVSGPYPSDGFLAWTQHLNYDGVLAMYHDQALIPFKATEFENGVNITAGLSFIRTSPDHGTAFDISGKNQADPTSFRQALNTALEISENRKKFMNLED